MTADDMTIRCTVAPTNEADDSPYLWKAKSTVFKDIRGYGNTIDDALQSFTDKIRKLYKTGALQLTNPNLEVSYDITQATAVIGLGVNPNRNLSDFGPADKEGVTHLTISSETLKELHQETEDDAPCPRDCKNCTSETCNSRQETTPRFDTPGDPQPQPQAIDKWAVSMNRYVWEALLDGDYKEDAIMLPLIQGSEVREGHTLYIYEKKEQSGRGMFVGKVTAKESVKVSRTDLKKPEWISRLGMMDWQIDKALGCNTHGQVAIIDRTTLIEYRPAKPVPQTASAAPRGLNWCYYAKDLEDDAK